MRCMGSETLEFEFGSVIRVSCEKIKCIGRKGREARFFGLDQPPEAAGQARVTESAQRSSAPGKVARAYIFVKIMYACIKNARKIFIWPRE